MLLSIVVAAFNVERYLGRCLGSLEARQARFEYEVIVVDDGSTDGTGAVADRWAADATNRRIIHQGNAGLGAARNGGLAAARGDYVWFVDGDDYLLPGALPRVMEALVARSPDVLVVDLTCADEQGRPIGWIQTGFAAEAGNVSTGADYFRRHFGVTYAWLYVIRRQLMTQRDLWFQPRINMQDAELLPRVLAAAASVVISGISAYVYVKRQDSFINNPALAVRQAYFASVVEVRRRLGAFSRSVCDPALRDGLEAKLRAIDGILLMAYTYDPLEREARSDRLAQLRRDKAFPFPAGTATSGHDPTPRERMLRVAVNRMPIVFPAAYRRLRENALVRRVRQMARTADPNAS